jgi:hypothetical protein
MMCKIVFLKFVIHIAERLSIDNQTINICSEESLDAYISI